MTLILKFIKMRNELFYEIIIWKCHIDYCDQFVLLSIIMIVFQLTIFRTDALFRVQRSKPAFERIACICEAAESTRENSAESVSPRIPVALPSERRQRERSIVSLREYILSRKIVAAVSLKVLLAGREVPF